MHYGERPPYQRYSDSSLTKTKYGRGSTDALGTDSACSGTFSALLRRSERPVERGCDRPGSGPWPCNADCSGCSGRRWQGHHQAAKGRGSPSWELLREIKAVGARLAAGDRPARPLTPGEAHDGCAGPVKRAPVVRQLPRDVPINTATGGPGSYGATNAQHSGQGHGRGHRKRDHSQNRPPDDDPGNGWGGGGGGGRQKKPRLLHGEDCDDGQFWACPFFKADPGTYWDCMDGSIRHPSDTRTHLHRKHRLLGCTSRCPRCGLLFFNDAGDVQKNAHLRQTPQCVRPDFAVQGVTESEWADIKKDARRKEQRSLEERWYAIWEVLFPHVAPPASPKVNAAEYTNVLRLKARAPTFPLGAVTHLVRRTDPAARDLSFSQVQSIISTALGVIAGSADHDDIQVAQPQLWHPLQQPANPPGPSGYYGAGLGGAAPLEQAYTNSAGLPRYMYVMGLDVPAPVEQGYANPPVFAAPLPLLPSPTSAAQPLSVTPWDVPQDSETELPLETPVDGELTAFGVSQANVPLYVNDDDATTGVDNDYDPDSVDFNIPHNGWEMYRDFDNHDL